MGFLDKLTAKKDVASNFPGADGGRQIWRQVFGSVSKEDVDKFPRVVPGGSYGRSITSAHNSSKRLLQALRSMAPGGWSDNRWEQWRHFVGIAYIAIHRSSEMMGQAEFKVFIKDESVPDGKRAVPRGHPGYQINKLLEKPNNDDTFGDMMYQWNQQMDLTGMNLTWMVPNMLQVPMELYVIPTALAIPQPAVNPDYPDGYYRIQPVYPYGPFSSYPTPASAVGAPIPAQWMLRIKYPHPLLRYDGWSPLTALRLHLDEVEMIDRSRHYSMRRQINPSAVLNFDEMEGSQPLPEEEIDRIKADMEADFQGPENAGRLYVSTPGAKLEPWGTSPKDMEFQAGWDQLVSFCLAGLGITKPVAGMVEDSSYSTLFASMQQYQLLTLGPKCQRIGAKLTRHLASFFGDDLIIEVRCQKVNDHDINFKKVDKLLSMRGGTINEARKLMDLPMIDLPWGNERLGSEPNPLDSLTNGAPPGGQGQQGPGQPPLARPGEGGMPGSPGTHGAGEPDPLDMVRGRGQPGEMGRGARGPRNFRNGNGVHV